MPELNGMKCTIDMGQNNESLQEYSTTYGNQKVDCLICVPYNDQHFSVHLTTTAFVASGLAAFVYIDGKYQANRNCTGLIVPDAPNSCSGHEVDFRFRQREEVDGSGKFLIGREWSFKALALAPNDTVPHVSRTYIENLGVIEVVVLRCIADNSLQPKRATDFGQDEEKRHRVRQDQVLQADAHQKESSDSSKREEGKATVPRPASVKTATPTPSEFLGFGSLLDGASDVPEDPDAGKTAYKATSADSIPYESYVKQRAQRQSSKTSVAGTWEPVEQKVMKPYWATWKSTSKGYGHIDDDHMSSALADSQKKQFTPKDPYVSPAYEQPQVQAAFATSRGLHVQATTGRGARYIYPRAKPKYIDSMDSPFAVFTFHYRSRQFFESSQAATSRVRASSDVHAAPSKRSTPSKHLAPSRYSAPSKHSIPSKRSLTANERNKEYMKQLDSSQPNERRVEGEKAEAAAKDEPRKGSVAGSKAGSRRDKVAENQHFFNPISKAKKGSANESKIGSAKWGPEPSGWGTGESQAHDAGKASGEQITGWNKDLSGGPKLNDHWNSDQNPGKDGREQVTGWVKDLTGASKPNDSWNNDQGIGKAGHSNVAW
ncbi:Ataxin-2 [Sphaceloma murrayae]|uniref:Ataxin-2 n=1 Tax=Sphaceloma murrayae TaxID=2082308 RepID=A0A2K1QU33_9PEZI|nr:Ataxin-2 [Sphaceloma murrayae]